MQILNNVSLQNYSTMRLGGYAQALTTVTTKNELAEAAEWAEQNNMPILFLGSGSNVIFHDSYKGLIVANRIPGIDIVNETDKHTTLKIGAGENWDEIVQKTVTKQLSGIECMSAIPGLAGAMPVQNAGAYGQETADTLTELEAYDLKDKKFVVLKNKECGFSYRNSIFKSTQNRRYAITNITLRLNKKHLQPPFYGRLQKYLDDNNIHDYTPANLRKAVIELRRILPNPAKLPNCGSFFKNPIVNVGLADRISQQYPDMPKWQVDDNHVKLAAGWLLDKAGLKGYKSHGMELYEKNALVVVNRSAKNYFDLADFRQEIIDKVRDTFDIQLEQEPELF